VDVQRYIASEWTTFFVNGKHHNDGVRQSKGSVMPGCFSAMRAREYVVAAVDGGRH
jgi:hypothetical protein